TGILAGAGLALALARLPDVGVPTLAPAPAPPAPALLPALVAGGWVIVATQPHGNWARRHVLDWSGDVAIGGIVRDLGPYAGVLAFGLGVLLGLAFERRGVGALAAPAAEKEDAPTRPTTRVEENVRDSELVREALLGACAAAVVAAAGCGRPRRCPPRRWRRWCCRSLSPDPRSPPSTSTRRARTLPGGSWIASLASEPLHAGTAQPLVPRIEGVLANAVGASFAVFFARTFQ